MPETCCDIPGAHGLTVAGPPEPGQPRVPVVVYGRVGSGSPGDAVAAISWQRVRAAEHAEKFGLRIVADFFDTATVRRTPMPLRPQGAAMLDRVRADPDIVGVITADAHHMIGTGNLRATMSSLQVPVHDPGPRPGCLRPGPRTPPGASQNPPAPEGSQHHESHPAIRVLRPHRHRFGTRRGRTRRAARRR